MTIEIRITEPVICLHSSLIRASGLVILAWPHAGVCLTLRGASITSETAMATQSEDIIALVKNAETEAAEAVKRAEEERREAIAQAEQQAAAAVAEARERCRKEQETAMEKAKAEAAELQSKANVEAEAAARDIQVVPEERLEKAADLLVENLRRQWQ